MITLDKTNCICFTLEKKKDSEIIKESVSYPDLHICFVIRGNALWEIGKKTYNVNPADIILLSDDQKRRFTAFGENGLTLRVISLDRRVFIGSHHLSFFLSCIRRTGGVFNNPDLCGILFELYDELKRTEGRDYELCSAKLTEFFIKAERFMSYAPAHEGKYDKKMAQVLDFIDENITEDITLCKAADFAGFTESSFSRWFAKANGVSFKKYVMTKKIDFAMTLLKTTDLKVVDIAYESGFDSVSGFYDTFKKITGTTPNKFSDRHNI